ncbi:L,D-transpeptidase family protein [Polycladidibacter stylochi]|uniref:L,D-transpeptidase family protein n=1 Tax=Polycladidibacter stylochi TaxID=1807766 RepID=UPI000AE2AE8E|nr:murein L,D-transpeptidase family protein [Pseudovibrio stylochi]
MMIHKFFKIILGGITLIALSLLAYDFSPIKFKGSANLAEVTESQLPKIKTILAQNGLTYPAKIYIEITKQPAELRVYASNTERYSLITEYDICTYSGQLGPKLKEGDRQAPEGFYNITPQQLNPKSSYHLAFNLGYPNAFDRQNGRTGSYLMVHGNCLSIGCYAMGNEQMEEIYLYVSMGLEALTASQPEKKPQVPVTIYPFALTDENMQRFQTNPNIAFWQQLKKGYDFFRQHHKPANMTAKGGRYTINY